MSNTLEQLKKFTTVVSDSGDFECESLSRTVTEGTRWSLDCRTFHRPLGFWMRMSTERMLTMLLSMLPPHPFAPPVLQLAMTGHR
jgi:hypothetical protein